MCAGDRSRTQLIQRSFNRLHQNDADRKARVQPDRERSAHPSLGPRISRAFRQHSAMIEASGGIPQAEMALPTPDPPECRRCRRDSPGANAAERAVDVEHRLHFELSYRQAFVEAIMPMAATERSTG